MLALRFLVIAVTGFFAYASYLGGGHFYMARPAYAICCGCSHGDCNAGEDYVHQQQTEMRNNIAARLEADLTIFTGWLVNDFWEKLMHPSLAMMTQQLAAVAMQHTQMIGTFFDAKYQLETQLLFQKMRVEASKTYQPSRDFCYFGTGVRSLASTESMARQDRIALNDMSMARWLGRINNPQDDTQQRWQAFRDIYCDYRDNNWKGEGTGLEPVCKPDPDHPPDVYRLNKDIDYASLIAEPRTIDVNFTDSKLTPDETDVVALSKNLYGHVPILHTIGKESLDSRAGKQGYLLLRSITAKRSVAMNSFNAQLALKAAGSSHIDPSSGKEIGSRQYLAAIIREILPSDASNKDVYELLGTNPSYYAQLEVLSKRLYQNPDFYVGLYGKPINVKRKGVALQAIDLMLDRALFESQLRREMLFSVLLSTKLDKYYRDANNQLKGRK